MIKFLPVLLVLVVSLTATPRLTPQVDIATQDPKTEELNQAIKLMESVRQHYQVQNYSAAITDAKRALEIRERLLPADSELIGESVDYLAQSHLHNHDFKEAKKMLYRLLESDERRVGPTDGSLVSTIDSLAVAHYFLDDNKTSEQLYLRSLKIREQKFGIDSPEAATGLYKLGEFYRHRGEFSKSLDVLKRALLIAGKTRAKNVDEFERMSKEAWCSVYLLDDYEKLKPHAEFMKQFDLKTDSSGNPIQVLNGKALSLPRPLFPDVPNSMRQSGMVVVKVMIDEEGRISNATDMCGAPRSLAISALQAAQKARFSPTLVDGKPINVSGVIVYRFFLQ